MPRAPVPGPAHAPPPGQPLALAHARQREAPPPTCAPRRRTPHPAAVVAQQRRRPAAPRRRRPRRASACPSTSSATAGTRGCPCDESVRTSRTRSVARATHCILHRTSRSTGMGCASKSARAAEKTADGTYLVDLIPLEGLLQHLVVGQVLVLGPRGKVDLAERHIAVDGVDDLRVRGA